MSNTRKTTKFRKAQLTWASWLPCMKVMCAVTVLLLKSGEHSIFCIVIAKTRHHRYVLVKTLPLHVILIKTFWNGMSRLLQDKLFLEHD